MTKVIGLTGGIGSGKSAVARMMRKFGACVIDTDKLAHEAYKPGTDVWRKIIETFGRNITDSSGKVDRKILGDIVFQDPAALNKLNEITHPIILEMTKAYVADCRRQNVPVVVIEAPLLIEAGWKGIVDEVWVVTAPGTKILDRLKKQRGFSPEEIKARTQSRLSDSFLKRNADVVIVNDGSRQHLNNQVEERWKRITSEKI